MEQPDVCIAGAGVVGLALALELARRGAHVRVFERGAALAESSWAAAGMLSAKDPGNPPQLQELADLSIELYPAFLEHVAKLSDQRVPLQTELTLQGTDTPSVSSVSRSDLDIFLPGHTLGGLTFTLLDEHSIDPRQLASALLGAAQNTSIELQTDTAVTGVESTASNITVLTAGKRHAAKIFVDCTGAWAASCPGFVMPAKGQMLSVALGPTSILPFVLRTHDLYIVPRTSGPSAGRALIGATVEDAGFDKTVQPTSIAQLQRRAARLLPWIADAPVVETWSGLRPVTADLLPLIGAAHASPRHLFATGHFRNGILLAPATAHVVAELIEGRSPAVNLAPFSPARLQPEPVV